MIKNLCKLIYLTGKIINTGTNYIVQYHTLFTMEEKEISSSVHKRLLCLYGHESCYAGSQSINM